MFFLSHLLNIQWSHKDCYPRLSHPLMAMACSVAGHWSSFSPLQGSFQGLSDSRLRHPTLPSPPNSVTRCPALCPTAPPPSTVPHSWSPQLTVRSLSFLPRFTEAHPQAASSERRVGGSLSARVGDTAADPGRPCILDPRQRDPGLWASLSPGGLLGPVGSYQEV